jgi:kynurenine formamidase
MKDGYTDTIPVQNFVAPVNVIDCSAEVAKAPDFLLTADQVRIWKVEHGGIGRGEWVVMRSDWDKHADDKVAFLNADETGLHSPEPTADCIKYILSKGIVGWGNQCIGTDAGQAGGMEPPFPVHNFLHKANHYGLASLANLDKLPAGVILIAAPLKIVRDLEARSGLWHWSRKARRWPG